MIWAAAERQSDREGGKDSYKSLGGFELVSCLLRRGLEVGGVEPLLSLATFHATLATPFLFKRHICLHIGC